MIDVSGEDIRIAQIKEIIELNLPVFVWGGENAARDIKRYLESNGVLGDIRYVVDDEYWSKDVDAMPFSEYLEQYVNDSIMVFGFYDYRVIMKKKKSYSDVIKHLYDFHLTRVNDTILKWDKLEVLDNIDRYQATYNMLSDEHSRRTMELYLRAAINGEFDNLYQKCHCDEQYFNEITIKAGVDTLVDCGAYDGDSIHDFVNVFENYKEIYAFEPDAANREKLIKRVMKEEIHNVEVISKGVYKEKATLFFKNDGNSSSHIDEEGESILVTTIDDVLKDKNVENDKLLIKMDIEGCELDALYGAAETIKEVHPCLAICVYHKECDLIDIPEFVQGLVGEGIYDYYLRFHGLDMVELVFYAVPKRNDK